jgi:DNA-directed RNA polymerase subunit RPC12/RpoP
MVCVRCGTLMRLLNKTKGRLRVFFCPECSRFAEAER